MTKLSQLFGVNADRIRTREFEFQGQKFRARVPLAKEAEAMFDKASNPSEEAVQAKYTELSKEFIDNRADIEEQKANVQYLEDDIIVGETSLKALAKTQAGNEIRVIESFKLLLMSNGEPLGDFTYDDIQAEFPLPIQLALVKRIAEVVSPSYEEVRKN